MQRRIRANRFEGRTVPAMLCLSARRLPEKVFIHFLDPALPEAPPREVTFAAFLRGVARAAAALSGAGVKAGDRILIVAENSPEWQMLALGAQLLRAEPAAAFASLSAEQVQTLAAGVAPRVIVASTASQWEKLAPSGAALSASGLRGVMCGDAISKGSLPPGVKALCFTEVFADGAPELSTAEVERLAAAVGEEDPFLLLFTSGTTGKPKGVRLPQRSVVHAVDSGRTAVATSEADRGLHFLPFAHVAGHDQFVLALAEGHALLMINRRGDLDRALALAPTYLFSVPLVYERIRMAVAARMEELPAPLRKVAFLALSAALRVRLDGGTHLADRALSALVDPLLGRAVRKRLGGKVRGLFSGGAPASPTLFRFFEALRIPFVELYGMSETAGLISSNLFSGERRAGSAGVVTSDHEIRISPDGELLLKGPLLFSGYLDPSDTVEAFTEDGFFRTGDVARFDEEGFLRVEGRKKHLLVLSTGKKLSPEPIEVALCSASPFEGALLLGEGRPFVSAVVFVGKEELDRLSSLGLDAAEALLPRAREALSAFSEFEKPKRLLVLAGAPQDRPDLITPTLKLRREAVLAEIGARVAALYARP